MQLKPGTRLEGACLTSSGFTLKTEDDGEGPVWVYQSEYYLVVVRARSYDHAYAVALDLLPPIEPEEVPEAYGFYGPDAWEPEPGLPRDGGRVYDELPSPERDWETRGWMIVVDLLRSGALAEACVDLLRSGALAEVALDRKGLKELELLDQKWLKRWDEVDDAELAGMRSDRLSWEDYEEMAQDLEKIGL